MSDVDILLQRANVLLEQNRNKEAIRELQQVLGREPNNHYAFSLIARCHYNQRKFDEGIAAAQQAISLSPSEDYYYYLLAFGRYQKDQNPGALTMLSKAIQLNPYAADYFGLYALISIEEKEFKKALEKADEGLSIDPENITCLNARSTALNKMRQTDAAVETMKNALEQDPENEFTHTTIGWNLVEKGRHKEAADHFREALRLHPNMESAQTGLKHALKSKIPPYRWLLQYSFWIENKGKNLRFILPIALYIIVRIVVSALGTEGSFSMAAMIVVALYMLFVITSWVINPIANFTLLFNKDGKYALTVSEKWSAITSVIALLIGSAILVTSLVIPHPGRDISPYLIPGLICFSLALPLSNMQFPLTFQTRKGSTLVSLLLVLLGIVSMIMPLIDKEGASFFLVIYFIFFIGYNWTGLFRN